MVLPGQTEVCLHHHASLAVWQSVDSGYARTHIHTHTHTLNVLLSVCTVPPSVLRSLLFFFLLPVHYLPFLFARLSYACLLTQRTVSDAGADGRQIAEGLSRRLPVPRVGFS